jgi:hypothetical protein
MKMFRQGDILFKKVPVLPDKRVEKADRVIAEGEVTGHRHMVRGGKLFDANGQLFVESFGEDITAIVHDEHAEIKLPDGFYKVVRQREETGPALPPHVVRD